MGFYFRNVTELILFGVRGKAVRTLGAGRTQVNLLATRKREHSRKPDELYGLIESCSWGPYLELFARTRREKWTIWGNEAPDDADRFNGPTHGKAYSNASVGDDFAQLRLCEGSPAADNRRRRKSA